MNLSKLFRGFVKVADAWICQSCSMYSSPFAKKNKLKFDQHSKACWSFCFELKVLNESKFSMPWVLCAFGNVSRLIMRPKFLDYDISIARTLRVINFTFAFNLEICETHASLNITIDL